MTWRMIAATAGSSDGRIGRIVGRTAPPPGENAQDTTRSAIAGVGPALDPVARRLLQLAGGPVHAMRQAVLLLNADFTPIKVLPWQRAMVLLLEEKVQVVSAYAGRAIRSATL